MLNVVVMVVFAAVILREPADTAREVQERPVTPTVTPPAPAV